MSFPFEVAVAGKCRELPVDRNSLDVLYEVDNGCGTHIGSVGKLRLESCSVSVVIAV